MSVPKVKHVRRRDRIKAEFLKGTSIKEIAEMLGVNERTIRRDLKKWREEGGFEEWLEAEFFHLHQDSDADWKTRYVSIARMKEKTLTQRLEQKIEGGQTFEIVVIDPFAEDNMEASSGSTEDPPE